MLLVYSRQQGESMGVFSTTSSGEEPLTAVDEVYVYRQSQWSTSRERLISIQHDLSRSASTLVGVDVSSRAVSPLSPHAVHIQDVAVASSGMLAYSQAGVIHLLDPATGAAASLANDGQLDVQPTWSSDGSMLAFVRLHLGEQGHSHCSLRTTVLHDLAPATLMEADDLDQPRWHPDGRRIVVSKSGVVSILDVQSGDVIDVAEGSGPVWSLEDGGELAYSAYGTLFVVDGERFSLQSTVAVDGRINRISWIDAARLLLESSKLDAADLRPASSIYVVDRHAGSLTRVAQGVVRDAAVYDQ